MPYTQLDSYQSPMLRLELEGAGELDRLLLPEHPKRDGGRPRTELTKSEMQGGGGGGGVAATDKQCDRPCIRAEVSY